MACLSCKIIAGEIPSKKVFEDEQLFTFEDNNPQAPMHMLIVPREHITTLNGLGSGNDALVGTMVGRVAAQAKDRGFDGSGYRTVMNCNSHAGQRVFHIHLHVLGSRALSWPPS